MQSLSTNRPIIIVMVGVPGAGKSHFARQFAKLFQTPLVSFDKIQYLLFAEPQFSKDEEILVASVMNSQIHELLKTQKTFIIDGAMHSRAARMEIARVARKHEYGMLTVWVQTDEDSAQYRATHRNKTREGDVYNTAMSEEQFAGYLKRINPPTEKEDHVVISGKHTFASQAKAVLKKIIAPRELPIANLERTKSTMPKRSVQKRRNYIS